MKQIFGGKALVICLLGGVTVFHIGAVFLIRDKNYELTSPDYYARESSYRDQVASLRAGAVYQWRLGVVEGSANLRILDASGSRAPLQDVSLQLYKPNNSAQDRTLLLVLHEDGWSADTGKLQKGLWRYTIQARAGDTVVAFRSSFNLQGPS